MSLLAIATKFNELIKNSKSFARNPSDINYQMELYNRTESDIFTYNIENINLEILLKLSIDSKEFVNHIERFIKYKDFSFLPSGIDREDTLCLCSATLMNNFKVIGSYVCPKNKCVKSVMKERAYADAINKLKLMERYSLMSKLYNNKEKLKGSYFTRSLIEENIISLLKNNNIKYSIIS